MLQPLDIGVCFSALARLYKQLIQRDAVFGAVRVDNRQFLLSYQEARKCITKKISGAWNGAGFIPFRPEKVLNRLKPKTPPFVSFTDDQGRHINVQMPDQITERINKLVDDVVAVCATPLRQEIIFFRDTTLTALADCRSLELLNDELAKKQRKKNNKAFTGARVLCMSDMIKQAEERREKEQKEEKEKARKKALRGVIGFAKQV